MSLAMLTFSAALALAQPAATPAPAQPPTPPTPPTADPALSNPAINDRLLEQQKRDPDETPIAPVQPRPGQIAIPSNPIPGLDLSGKARFPEGTFLAQRRGKLVISPRGDAILAPLPDDAAHSPPLVLLPCASLEQLRSAQIDADSVVTISGQVFQYHDRPYLLPTLFAVASAAPAAPTTKPESKPETKPDSKPTAKPAQDPSVTELIQSLEAERLPPRALNAAPAPAATTATAATPNAAPKPEAEGTVLLGRRARLVRLPELHGRLAVAFDNDPNSPSGGPLVLLPCRAVENLEALAALKGENTAFRISGRVFVYEGRGYCLPTLVQVTRAGDIGPMQ